MNQIESMLMQVNGVSNMMDLTKLVKMERPSIITNMAMVMTTRAIMDMNMVTVMIMVTVIITVMVTSMSIITTKVIPTKL